MAADAWTLVVDGEADTFWRAVLALIEPDYVVEVTADGEEPYLAEWKRLNARSIVVQPLAAIKGDLVGNGPERIVEFSVLAGVHVL